MIIKIAYSRMKSYQNHKKRFESEAHNVCTEKINKIPLSSNDDKRLETFDRITSYSYGTSAGKVCKRELLEHLKYKND